MLQDAQPGCVQQQMGMAYEKRYAMGSTLLMSQKRSVFVVLAESSCGLGWQAAASNMQHQPTCMNQDILYLLQ